LYAGIDGNMPLVQCAKNVGQFTKIAPSQLQFGQGYDIKKKKQAQSRKGAFYERI
jgi:hypothetical protein